MITVCQVLYRPSPTILLLFQFILLHVPVVLFYARFTLLGHTSYTSHGPLDHVTVKNACKRICSTIIFHFYMKLQSSKLLLRASIFHAKGRLKLTYFKCKQTGYYKFVVNQYEVYKIYKWKLVYLSDNIEMIISKW